MVTRDVDLEGMDNCSFNVWNRRLMSSPILPPTSESQDNKTHCEHQKDDYHPNPVPNLTMYFTRKVKINLLRMDLSGKCMQHFFTLVFYSETVTHKIFTD